MLGTLSDSKDVLIVVPLQLLRFQGAHVYAPQRPPELQCTTIASCIMFWSYGSAIWHWSRTLCAVQVDPALKFYTSLRQQKPDSEMAKKW